QRTTDLLLQLPHPARQLGQDVGGGGVLQRVHGVEAQRVDVEITQPHQRVLDNELAHGGFLGVDQVAPGAASALQVRAEAGQVVTGRAEVVVDDVEHDGQAARVGGVDEAFEPVRSAERFVYRVPGDPVVTPVPDAVDGVDRQHLDVRDAELDEVVEPFDRRVECGARRERADV